MSDETEKLNIQWFPGHMTKAQRMIEEHMKQVDAVCEILDARIPMASRNPDIDRLAGDKPRIVALNKTDAMDAKQISDRRRALEKASGGPVHVISGVAGRGIPEVLREIYGTIRGQDPVEERGAWQP